RITLTPTLVLKDGQPAIAVSVAGGDGQDQAGLQVLLNLIDFGMAPAEAVTAPRFGTGHFLGSFRQAKPAFGSLRLNVEIGEAVAAELTGRGHQVQLQKGAMWTPCVLTIDPKTRLLQAAGDPKAGRHAAGY